MMKNEQQQKMLRKKTSQNEMEMKSRVKNTANPKFLYIFIYFFL